MSNNVISKLLTDNRLSRVAGDLVSMLQPAIRLETFPCQEGDLPLGATRIGGRPDLTDDVVWPVWKGKPLAFLAQINLSDLVRFPFAGVLPRDGWLLFFYDAEQSTWGFAPQDVGSWAVIWMLDDKSPLKRRGIPSETLAGGFYKPCRVEMREVLTAPPFESPFIRELHLTESEEDAYWDFLENIHADEEGEVSHQILGHPEAIQGDMQLECQLVSNGLYCGDSSGYNDPRAKELAKGAEDWQLLFQVDSDDNAGMMWGDVGMLYFWIRQEDLLMRAFEKSWMILQCG